MLKRKTPEVFQKVFYFFKQLLTFIRKITRKKEDKNPPDQKPPINTKPVHAWRQCPLGEHWVLTHPLRVPPSKKHPSGTITTRNGHCSDNPTDKDHLYSEEIQEISKIYFDQFKLIPLPEIPEFQKRDLVYDHFIQGWTQYWNDVLKPQESLDPCVVKALIASESSFDSKAWNKLKGLDRADGLMQVTHRTVSYLKHNFKELRDHYLNLDAKDMVDPNLSICAGIRWLFRKKELAGEMLKRSVSWREAIIAFKGINFNDKTKINELMKDFDKYYNELKGIK